MTPDEIDTYCQRLAKAWKKIPDTNLGEIISINALEYDIYVGREYFRNNEALITAIERMVEK